MSKDIEISGLDNMEKTFDTLIKNAESIDGTNSVSFEDLFPVDFMASNTEFNSFSSFAEASGFDASTQESFEAIPDKPWDDWVEKNSTFASWEEMYSTAVDNYINAKLFANL